MPMKNPPHPGGSIRRACLEPLGLSVTEGARVLGVTRQTLNNVINGKSGISPEMAIRLSKGTNHGPWDRRAIIYAGSILPSGEKGPWLGLVEENAEDPLERAVAQHAMVN
jgi:addiction module HigA family antidote